MAFYFKRKNLAAAFVCALAAHLASCGADKAIVRLLDPPAPLNRPTAVIGVGVIADYETGIIYARLDGSGSADPGMKTLTYKWELAEIPPGSAAALASPASMITQFTADFSGCYSVTLTVTNSAGAVSPTAVERLRIINAAGGGREPGPDDCRL